MKQNDLLAKFTVLLAIFEFYWRKSIFIGEVHNFIGGFHKFIGELEIFIDFYQLFFKFYRNKNRALLPGSQMINHYDIYTSTKYLTSAIVRRGLLSGVRRQGRSRASCRVNR